MLKAFLKKSITYNIRKILLYTLLSTVVVALILVGGRLIYSGYRIETVDPNYLITFTLIILTIICAILIFVGRKNLKNFWDFSISKKYKRLKLHKRIITAFTIGAAVPTITVAVFSIYFFNFGIQSWFDDRISKILDESITVGESYVTEHVLQLKETAISVAEDLNERSYDLMHNSLEFNKMLNAEVEMRSLDEAIVFQKTTGTILAQTSLSFSLAFTAISRHLIEKADKGEVVYIGSDPTKIRILFKLSEYYDTYLLIGRLVDSKIIEHISKTNGAAEEYFSAKEQMRQLQIKFALVFCLLVFILLIVAIMWGSRFASHIVRPIRELVIAAEKVKNGDLTVQVPEHKLKKDELKVLSSAFNRMVKQIDLQQKELLVAQRSLAWSDVAKKVAHEIKNPLTPIQLSADMLNKKFRDNSGDPQVFGKYIKNILAHTNDIKNIVAEFVEFARLPLPNFARYDLVSMIGDLVESRKMITPNILYSFNSTVKEYFLICDMSQMNRALFNLLKNAEESFDNSINRPQISIDFILNGEFTIILVQDNGLGFTKEVIDIAKESYVTTKTSGMGLGLSIVDKIVKEHFGTLEIYNRAEGGAAIRLTFNAKELNYKLK